MSLLSFGRRSLWFVILPLIWLGCRTGSDKLSSHLATVLITNQPVERVELMTRAVFRAHDFQPGKPKPGEIIFEKPGTAMNTLVYGDFSEKRVWIRAKVFIRELNSTNQVMLACDGYMIADYGDQHFEEEHKLTGMHRGRFQELLDEICQRLKFPD